MLLEKRGFMRTLTACLVLGLSFDALASEDEPIAVTAVQKRQYHLNHELSLSAGYLPLDAFYKGITGNASYTYHFTDHFGWKVARGALAKNLPTDLRRKLERDFGVLPTEFPEVEWMIGSDLVFSPLYGKVSLMNRLVVHLQLYVLAGGSAVKLQKDVVPGVNVGGGIRFFLTERFSLRLEGGNHFVFGRQQINVLDLQLGLSANLGPLN